jgi:hypothetical protein
MYSIVRMGAAALIIATITVWSTAQASDSIVGSWRLVSWVQEDVEGKAVRTVFGDNPVGGLRTHPMGTCRCSSPTQNQGWNGTDQQRFIEVKDNRLTIKTPPIVSPISGKKSVNTLVWERMK